MNTTTKGSARRQTLGDLLPVVGVALAVALVVAMVVGPSTSSLRARLSLVDAPASVQAGSPDATSQAGVTVQVRPRRAITPAGEPVEPADLVTGDLARPARASTNAANATDATNSTSSSARSTNVRIAPNSTAPLLGNPSDLLATPLPAPASPPLASPVAPLPSPRLDVAAGPTKQPTRPLKPATPNSPTTAGPKAGRGSASAPTGGGTSADRFEKAANKAGANAEQAANKSEANAEKLASRVEASAEKAANKADRPANSDWGTAPTKKDKA